MSKESRAFRDAMEELSDLDQGGISYITLGQGPKELPLPKGPCPYCGCVAVFAICPYGGDSGECIICQNCNTVIDSTRKAHIGQRPTKKE